MSVKYPYINIVLYKGNSFIQYLIHAAALVRAIFKERATIICFPFFEFY